MIARKVTGYKSIVTGILKMSFEEKLSLEKETSFKADWGMVTIILVNFYSKRLLWKQF